MQRFLSILLLACALAAVSGRQLQQAKFKSVGEALTETSQLSTLLAAVKAAGLSVPDEPVTIFAPTNKAFSDDDLKEKTGLTAAQLLLPANKAVLTQVLQFHIVPTAAVKSSQLKNGQEVKTALAGAAPLKVKVKGGKVEVMPSGQKDNTADVVTADVMAGKAVVHVIDEVLIPPSLLRKAPAAGSKP